MIALVGRLGDERRPGVSVYLGNTGPGSVEVLSYQRSLREPGAGLPDGLACWLERNVVCARDAGSYRYRPPFRFADARDAADWAAALCAEALDALVDAGRLERLPGIGWAWWITPGDELTRSRPLRLRRR